MGNIIAKGGDFQHKSANFLSRVLLVYIAFFAVINISSEIGSAYDDNSTYFTCYNSADCGNALNNNTHNEVHLGQNVSGVGSNFINNPANLTNKTFNGMGYTITGGGVTQYGIYSKSKDNFTITNITILNFSGGSGIYMWNGNNNIFSDIITDSGMFLCGQSSNIMVDNSNFTGHNSNGYAIWGTSNSCTANTNNSNLTIQNSIFNVVNGNNYNVYVSGSSATYYNSVNLYNLTFSNITHGIYFLNVNGTNINKMSFANVTTATGYGVLLNNLSGSTSINNSIFNNVSNGMLLQYVNGSIIYNNTIIGQTGAGFGIKVDDTSTGIHNFINNHFLNTENRSNLTSNGIQLWSQTPYAVIDGNDVSGYYNIAIRVANNSIVINNNVTMIGETHGGVYLLGNNTYVANNSLWNLDFNSYTPSWNSIVYNNTIDILELKGAVNATITYNTITQTINSWGGIWQLADSTGSNISYNNFIGSGAVLAVGTMGVRNNIISYNIFNTTNSYALYLNNATNNTVENNTVTYSAGTAFSFTANTSDNKGCGNTGPISDSGTNYITNTSQACYIWQSETLDNMDRMKANGTYILKVNVSEINISTSSTLNIGNFTSNIIRVIANAATIISNYLNSNILFSLNANANTKINLNGTNFELTSNDSINVSLIAWNTSGNYYKLWNESSSNSSTITNHTIGDFPANAQIVIKKNGAYWNTFTSNASGYINFTYSEGYSNIQFEALQDTTMPTVSLSLSSSPIYQGQSITISCSSSDNYQLSSTSLTVTKPSGTTTATCGQAFTDTSTTGIYTVIYTATDTSGNSASASQSFTVSQLGGSSKSASTTSTSRAQETQTITAASSEAVEKITVNLNAQIAGAFITIAKMKSTPAGVPSQISSETESVYQYLNITRNNFNNSQIENATIEFKVNKSWILANTFTNISLARYDSRWKKLKTEMINETASQNIYRAYTDGFSYFAVVGEKAVAAQVPQQNITEQSNVPSSKPSAQNFDSNLGIAVALVSLLLIAGIYAARKKIKTKKKRKHN